MTGLGNKYFAYPQKTVAFVDLGSWVRPMSIVLLFYGGSAQFCGAQNRDKLDSQAAHQLIGELKSECEKQLVRDLSKRPVVQIFGNLSGYHDGSSKVTAHLEACSFEPETAVEHLSPSRQQEVQKILSIKPAGVPGFQKVRDEGALLANEIAKKVTEEIQDQLSNVKEYARKSDAEIKEDLKALTKFVKFYNKKCADIYAGTVKFRDQVRSYERYFPDLKNTDKKESGSSLRRQALSKAGKLPSEDRGREEQKKMDHKERFKLDLHRRLENDYKRGLYSVLGGYEPESPKAIEFPSYAAPGTTSDNLFEEDFSSVGQPYLEDYLEQREKFSAETRFSSDWVNLQVAKAIYSGNLTNIYLMSINDKNGFEGVYTTSTPNHCIPKYSGNDQPPRKLSAPKDLVAVRKLLNETENRIRSLSKLHAKKLSTPSEASVYLEELAFTYPQRILYHITGDSDQHGLYSQSRIKAEMARMCRIAKNNLSRENAKIWLSAVTRTGEAVFLGLAGPYGWAAYGAVKGLVHLDKYSSSVAETERRKKLRAGFSLALGRPMEETLAEVAQGSDSSNKEKALDNLGTDIVLDCGVGVAGRCVKLLRAPVSRFFQKAYDSKGTSLLWSQAPKSAVKQAPYLKVLEFSLKNPKAYARTLKKISKKPLRMVWNTLTWSPLNAATRMAFGVELSLPSNILLYHQAGSFLNSNRGRRLAGAHGDDYLNLMIAPGFLLTEKAWEKLHYPKPK